VKTPSELFARIVWQKLQKAEMRSDKCRILQDKDVIYIYTIFNWGA